jgi:hypothetical protein
MMTDKAIIMSSLNKSLDNIYVCYSKIYDLYHSDGDVDRDVYFIHDLVDALEGIEAVLEVYTRDNYIHPHYASEKLSHSVSLIKYIKEYFDMKGHNNE